MTNEGFGNARQQFAEPLAVGQPVEIRRGLLRGLSGVLAGFGHGDNCLVELDGMQSGILLSIASTSVRQKLTELTAKAPGVDEEPIEMPRP